MKIIITESQYESFIIESILKEIMEATYEPQKIPNNPAMMTWDEYSKFNNPEQRFSVNIIPYDWEDHNIWDLKSGDNYPSTSGGHKLLYFADSESGITYLRRDAPQDMHQQAKLMDNVQMVDNIIPKLKHRHRGMDLPYTEEPQEKEKLGEDTRRIIKGEPFKLGMRIAPKGRTFIYVENDGIFVGSSELFPKSDTVMTYIMADYNGYGIGGWLATTIRRIKPQTKSGAQSMGGHRMLKKIHTKAVKKYLSAGIYSDMIRKGQITPQKVREIVLSTKSHG